MPPKKRTGRLVQDRLVEQLIPDPADHQPTIQLTGWLGKSSKEGFWRLYLTPQLNEYVQFAETAVLHSQPIPEEQSPLGGTVVWLEAGTTLEHLEVVKRQVQADFLSGGITSNYLSTAPSAFNVAAAGRVIGEDSTRGFRCSINPHIPACQLRTEVCPIGSLGIGCGTGTFCGTREFVCGATVGCSVGRE